MSTHPALFQEFESTNVVTSDDTAPILRPERTQVCQEIVASAGALVVERFEGCSNNLSENAKPVPRLRKGHSAQKAVVLRLEGDPDLLDLGEFIDRLNGLLATLPGTQLKFVRVGRD